MVGDGVLAVGAGVLGGLAVGALAAQPFYYGYGYPGYAYGYGYPSYAYGYGYPAYSYDRGPASACSYDPWNCF